MQVKPEELAARLQKQPWSFVWVHGDEPLQLLECADAARASARQLGVMERITQTVDRSYKPSDLVEQLAEVSLFGDARLVELRLGENKPTVALQEVLVRCLEWLGPGEGHRLLVTSGRLDARATKAAWFTAVDRLAWVVPVWPIERSALPQWIGRRLSAQGQYAPPDLLQWLAEKVEGNLMAAAQEIRKLGLLCPQGSLDRDVVEAAVMNVARYDAFDAVGALLAGDLPRAIRGLDGLRAEGEFPPLTIWAMSDAVRHLWALAQAQESGQSLNQALASAGLFGPRAAPYQNALQRLAGQRLGTRAERALRLLAQADKMTKGVAPGDPWQTIADATRLLCPAPARAHTAAPSEATHKGPRGRANLYQ